MDSSTTGGEPTTSVPDTDSLVRDVVTTVADAEAVNPLELPPLYDAIDPEARDALFGSNGGPAPVEFDYLGYRVLVREDGGIEVTDEAD